MHSRTHARTRGDDWSLALPPSALVLVALQTCSMLALLHACSTGVPGDDQGGWLLLVSSLLAEAAIFLFNGQSCYHGYKAGLAQDTPVCETNKWCVNSVRNVA